MTQQQQNGRSITWHSNVEASVVLVEILCAIRQRYAALSLPAPTFSVLGITGNDQASYSSIMSAVASANTDVLNSLIAQIVTAVNGLSGKYYDQSFAPIIVNLTAEGWSSIPVIKSSLTLMCMLPCVVRNINTTYKSVTTPVCGVRSASFLLPRLTDLGPIVAYQASGTSSVTASYS